MRERIFWASYWFRDGSNPFRKKRCSAISTGIPRSEERPRTAGRCRPTGACGSQKILIRITICLVMSPYKRIERQIGEYIAARYHRVVEVGIGRAPEAARVIAAAGRTVTATDLRPVPADGITVIRDDIF